MREWSQKHIEELIKKYGGGGNGDVGEYTEVLPLSITDLNIISSSHTSNNITYTNYSIDLDMNSQYYESTGLVICHLHNPELSYLIDTYANTSANFHTLVRLRPYNERPLNIKIGGFYAPSGFYPENFSYIGYTESPILLLSATEGYESIFMATTLNNLINTENYSGDIVFKNKFEDLTANEKLQHYCATDFVLVR